MTYIIVSIVSVWAVAIVTFFAALGLAAKRPMPAPDTLDHLGVPGDLHYAAPTSPAEDWQTHAEPNGLRGAVAHSAA